MRRFLLLALIATALAARGPIRYDNFKVYRVTPQNQLQLQSLRDLQVQSTSYSFWTEVNSLNVPVDILVAPHLEYDFQDLVSYLNLKNEVYIDNVQTLIDNENVQNRAYSNGRLNWNSYGTLDDINAWLSSLEEQNPGVVTVVKGGVSYEGRDILGVKIAYKEGLKKVFIEGGIHAREWISPATVTYITNELLNSEDPKVRALAESREWHIFPSFNPDGYVYTHQVDRLWRKSRKPYGLCRGADPNRNWGYKWNHGGVSNNPCEETYAGSEPFSDVETKSLSEYITSIGDNLEVYLAFHSYSQLLLIPFGHSGLEVPANNQELLTIGQNAANVLSQRYGTSYEVGNIPQTIYVASGISSDWALGTNRNIRIVYTYELRDTGRYGFVLPPDQIIPTGQETFDSVLSIFDQVEASS